MASRSSCGVGIATREQDDLLAATRWTPSSPRGSGLNLQPAVNPLYGITCAGGRGDSRLQSSSGPQIAADASCDSARFELTAAPLCNYSQPEVLKPGVLSFGEPQLSFGYSYHRKRGGYANVRTDFSRSHCRVFAAETNASSSLAFTTPASCPIFAVFKSAWPPLSTAIALR